MPRLIHLTGPSGVGTSTLARRPDTEVQGALRCLPCDKENHDAGTIPRGAGGLA